MSRKEFSGTSDLPRLVEVYTPTGPPQGFMGLL
jgi:hypothetical protein